MQIYCPSKYKFVDFEKHLNKIIVDTYMYFVSFSYRAVVEDDAFTRMKGVVKWYLSGFYKKPQGLKKPYNPLLGETFRCYWQHSNGSRTFYIAEQVYNY